MKLRIVSGIVVVVLGCSATVRGGMVPDMLVASRNTHQVLRYDGDTGNFVGVFAEGGGLTFPDDLAFGPDGNLYVGSGGNILRFNGQTGAFIDEFATSNMGRFGLAFGPDGDLYTAFGGGGPGPGTWGVLRFDGETGENLGPFVSLPSGQIVPTDLDFGPDNNLYLAVDGAVRRFDGESGEFIDIFLGPEGFNQIIGFQSDDNFYGGPLFGAGLSQYDGESGELINIFSGGELEGSSGFTLGPDGSLYVSSGLSDTIVRFDAQSAEFIETFVSGPELAVPRDVLFIPEPASVLCMAPGALLLVIVRRKTRA